MRSAGSHAADGGVELGAQVAGKQRVEPGPGRWLWTAGRLESREAPPQAAADLPQVCAPWALGQFPGAALGSEVARKVGCGGHSGLSSQALLRGQP